MALERLAEYEAGLFSRIIKIYFPFLCLSLIAFALINSMVAFVIALIFIAIQLIICEINYFAGEEFFINRLKLDIAPLAAIFLGYYFSFFAGFIGMLVPLLIQDFDRETSKFAELEDIIFNSIVALAAYMFRSVPFLPLAIALIVLRLVGLLLMHLILLGELNPRKFLSEGSSAFILLAVMGGLLRIFG